MKKLFVALIVAASMVAYFLVGDLRQPEVLLEPPMAQGPASSAQDELSASAAVASEPSPEFTSEPAVAPVLSRTEAPVRAVRPAIVPHAPDIGRAAVTMSAPTPEPEPVVPKQDLRLTIREISFDGVNALSQEELQSVVKEFIGQELNLEQTLAIPARISSYYQSKNMVATATLIGSVASNGVLRVGVMESQISQSQLAQQLQPLAAVEKVQSKLSLSEDDETELILKQYGKQSRQYELIADNYGYEATGSSRLGAGMVWNDALGRGNQLSLQGLKSKGSDYARAAFEWATGIDGLKLGASVSRLNYEVVNGLQDAFNLSGEAVKQGGGIAYELFNDASGYSRLSLRYDSAKFRNHAVQQADSAYYDTQVMGIEFKGFEREMSPGGAVFTYNLGLSKGDVDLNGSPNQTADQASENTGGSFQKLRFTGTILQPLGGVNALYMGLTVQRADKNLDNSEKLYLGGPLGVRAYGVGEGMGSQGEIATLEFRQRLSAQTTLSEFYDMGHIRPWQSAGQTQSGATLGGVGIGLSHALDSGVSLKGTWARRVGNTPEIHVMPRGHQGEYDRSRFWLSLESRF